MANSRRLKSQSRHSTTARDPTALVDAASPRVDAAMSLWREGRRTEAHELLREATRLEPRNLRPYVAAARAYAEQFRFDKMEDLLGQLVQLGPQHPGVHHYRGEIYGSLKLPIKAIECYECAARLPGALPPTWMELAGLYESAHRLDEAHELIERTVGAGFDLPLVWLVRGRIQRRRGEFEQAEATFRELAARLPDSEWACQAWGEVALMRDRQADYAGAVAAIEECKQSQRKRETRLLTASDQAHVRLRKMIVDLSRDDFARWRDEAAELPTMNMALLTGFPRSGTTLLEQLLDAHPELVSSEERDFVGRELVSQVMTKQGAKPVAEIYRDLSLTKIASLRERYFPAMQYLLGESIGDRIHLDKNPAYNLTIPLMLRVFPETRLVVALRDPRDVVLSCYLRYLPLNSVSVRFLTPERTAERYALDMSAWLQFRELIDNPWCEVRYEDTVHDPAHQAQRALETLGLEWDNQVLNYRERLGSQKVVTSPTYEAVAQPVHTQAIGRWQHYQQLLAPAMKHLAPYVKAFGYDL